MLISGLCGRSAPRRAAFIFFDFFVAGSRYLRYNGADNGFLIGWCI